MLTTDTMQAAMESYRRGTSLMNEEKFKDAIPFLNRAAEAFRKGDAEGHPAERTLENGVSALANALYYLGLCFERTGDVSRAVTCFETAYINERFERPSAFRSFSRILESRLITCYEQYLTVSAAQAVVSPPAGGLVIDTTARFPFSLEPKLIPYARLYEMEPQRYEHLRTFYEAAKRQDATRRSTGRENDELSMHKISIGVWSVIAAIWIVYGVAVIRTLIHAR